MHAADKNLRIIDQELRFIARHSQAIEGAGSSDFETVDELNMAVGSALRALAEYRLSLEPTCEAVPAGVAVAA
ncbi:MAG: hypothetical protein H7Z38_23495 [Rubrivivax sp.]|nr:hypothetical protein [Pyrinomonadaceae bacterium]